MFKHFLRYPQYLFFYYFGFPVLPPVNLVLSLTYRCNSKCKTCNIWKKAPVKDLTPAEYQKIFKSIGKGYVGEVILTGGEPFLRKDIRGICSLITEELAPRAIVIPTNGLLTTKIINDVKKITQDNPRTEIIVNLSIDEIEKLNDEIRGVANAWEKAMATYKKLRKLKRNNFSLKIHTVISQYNVRRIPEIYEAFKKLKPDGYITEIAENRVELENLKEKVTPLPEEYAEAIDYILKKERVRGDLISRITLVFRQVYYEMVKKILREKKQIIPCKAGVVSAQISPEGKVWGCCIRADVLGNLREEDYNFMKIWRGAKAQQFRQKVKAKKCFCPLANVAYTNILYHPPTLLKVAGKLI